VRVAFMDRPYAHASIPSSADCAVEVSPHGAQTDEPLSAHHGHWREAIEGLVAGAHPCVREIAVLWEQTAKVGVDRQQVAHAFCGFVARNEFVSRQRTR